MFRYICNWSICKLTKDVAKINFDIIANFTKNAFYAYVRKNIIDRKSPWNYILIVRSCKDYHSYIKTEWWYENAYGIRHDTLQFYGYELDEFPKYDFPPAEYIYPKELTFEEDLVERGFKLDEMGEWNGDGDVYINTKKAQIKDGKLTVKFGRVSGSFYCSNNELTTLEGCPREFGGNFYCNNLKIKTLKGAPQKCQGFYCTNCNELVDLNGAPTKCFDFSCVGCKNLVSLEGAPEKVDNFNCSECINISNLKGAPKFCKYFTCSDCTNLKSLEGLPLVIFDSLNCRNCSNISLDYHKILIIGKIIH